MIEAQGQQRASLSGEEELRFIRNFHDVFLSIGLLMFAAGLALVTWLIFGNIIAASSLGGWRGTTWQIAGLNFLDAAVMWMIAEIFARGRRLFLPAIVILIAFSGFVAVGATFVYVAAFAGKDVQTLDAAFEQLKFLPVFVASVTAFGVFAYYVRTKLPFSMGVGAVSIVLVAIAWLGYWRPQLVFENAMALQFGAGLFLFLVGVGFDARDPARRTRFSDNAFWLHFFAAPLIFLSVMDYVSPMRGLEVGFGTGRAMVTLAVIFVFAVISLLINRRALLVSGLLSAAGAIWVLVSRAGFDGGWTAALTLLLLGGTMVLLGGGWHSARRALVAPFPKSGPIARVIPPEPRRGEERDEQGR